MNGIRITPIFKKPTDVEALAAALLELTRKRVAERKDRERKRPAPSASQQVHHV